MIRSPDLLELLPFAFAVSANRHACGRQLAGGTGNGVALLVDPHAQRESHGGKDFLDLIERLAAEVLGLEHFGFGLLHQLADSLDIRVLQAVVTAYGKLQLFHRAVQILILDPRLVFASGFSLKLLFKVDEDGQVVLKQLRRQTQRVGRSDGAVGPDLDIELVVIGDLAQPGGLNGVIALAHRRGNRVDGNKAEAQVLIKVLVGGNVAATALQAHLHVQLTAFRHPGDVNILVQDLDVAIRLDHAGSDVAGLIGLEIDGFLAVAVELKGDLLQVEDDVGGIFHDARDGLKLVQHAFNANRRDGCAFNRRQQHAPQGVADGCTEPSFELLRVKAAG